MWVHHNLCGKNATRQPHMPTKCWSLTHSLSHITKSPWFRLQQFIPQKVPQSQKLETLHTSDQGDSWAFVIGWDPSVCKSNRLHVDMLQFSFIKLGYILYSITLKWSVILLQSWTSTGSFLNSTASSVANCRVLPDHRFSSSSLIWSIFHGFL